MLFKIDLPTPANTSYADRIVTPLRVYPGTVRRVWVGFPHGCFGLCHVKVYQGSWQVWPWDVRTDFHWNDYVFTFEDFYRITDEPCELRIEHWNLDDSYDHTPFFAVLIEPETATARAPTLEEIWITLTAPR